MAPASSTSSSLSALRLSAVVSDMTVAPEERFVQAAATAASATTTTGGGKKQQGEELDWSFLDAAYLITCPNADPGSARLTRTLGILSDLGLSDIVEIKTFDTDDEDRIRGCYDSHIAVMREALGKIEEDEPTTRDGAERSQSWWQQLMPFGGGSNGEEDTTSASLQQINGDAAHATAGCRRDANILVLEDNLGVGFTGPDRSNIDAVSAFMSSSSWDMIHLSYIPYVPNLIVSKTPASDAVVQLSTGLGSALGTTAYVVNRGGIEALVKEDDRTDGYRGAAIPDVMAELFPESRYAAEPAPFLRAPTTASLVNPQLDDLRALLFQPPVVRAVQGLLSGTGFKSNDLLFAVVGALLGVAGVAGRVTVDAGYQLATTGGYEGNAVLPLFSSMFSVVSLAIVAQGAALAPKPEAEEAVAE